MPRYRRSQGKPSPVEPRITRSRSRSIAQGTQPSTSIDDHEGDTTASNDACERASETTLRAPKLDHRLQNSAAMADESYPNPSIGGISAGQGAVTQQKSPAPPPPLPPTEADHSSSLTKTKPTDNNPDTVQCNGARNTWGDSRFAEESRMMQAHAESLLAAGAISASQAARLSVPWHDRGVVNGSIWEEAYLDPSKKVTEYEVPPYEKVRKARHRKDLAQQKWLEDWEAGRIDDDGNPIAQAGSSRSKTGACNINVAAEQSDGDAESVEVVESRVATLRGGGAGNISGERYAMIEKSRPDTPRKIKNATGTKGKEMVQDLETIAEESSNTDTSALDASSSTKSTSTEDVAEASSSFASVRPPITVKANPGKPPAETSTQVRTGSSFMTWTLEPPPTSVSAYSNLEYGELLRLCRQRGLKRSGNVDTLSQRLMADDVAVRDGTPRKDLSKYKTPADGSVKPRGVTGKRSRSKDKEGRDEEPGSKRGRVGK